MRDARRIAERLRRRIEALAIAHPTSPVGPHVTVSIGVSAVRPHASHPSDALIETSDRALYVAKARGRNRVVARAVPQALISWRSRDAFPACLAFASGL